MMRFFNTHRRLGGGRYIFIPVAVIAFASIVTATIVIARSSRRASLPAGSRQTHAVATQSNNHPGSIEAELITVRPWGFEPKEITRPPGPFFLAIDNHSQLDEIDISLDPESGPGIKAQGLSKNKAKWRQKMVLVPGTYLLREANHPEWTCRITIQP